MAASFNITGRSPTLSAGKYLVVAATQQRPPGRAKPADSRFRKVYAANNPTLFPATILGAYVAIWGTLIAGQEIWVKAYVIDSATGFESLPTYTLVTVA